MKASQWAALFDDLAGWCGYGDRAATAPTGPEVDAMRTFIGAQFGASYAIGQLCALAGFALFARLMAIVSEGEP